jgi:acetolactate synthase-1/2/3 large subunit
MVERSGAHIVIDNLVAHGVDRIFQVPGESFLAVLDALHDRNDIRIITCRHEAGAANMAEATGKITGRPGVCFVTRGPGSGHAAVAVQTAFQDSTPMILFVGQVGLADLGREAFQEVDLHAMFGWTAKFAGNIPSVERIPEYISRAFSLAQSGRPGPVVLGLPEEIQEQQADVADSAPALVAEPSPSPEERIQLARLLAEAKRPLMIVGGSRWTQEACDQAVAFAERHGIPVAVTFRRQDHFDNSSVCYIGDLAFALDPGLAQTFREADCILAVGTRLGDLASGGYGLLGIPSPGKTLIHVYPEPGELGRVFRPDLAIAASPVSLCNALAAFDIDEASFDSTWLEAARARYLASIEPVSVVGDIDMRAVIATLGMRLGVAGVITSDAGNFAQWAQRFFPFRKLGTQIAPRSGAMGYGVPSAIAAKLLHPDQPVVGLIGDGGFLMSSSELATAVQHGVAPVLIVFNNGIFGTIRAHQERRFPGRVVGTDLRNPDFSAVASAFGAWSARVSRTEQFAGALDQALAAGRAAVIEIMLDPEAISVGRSLSQIREAAIAGRTGKPA